MGEEPVINSYLDDPDPKWSTLRKASSTSRIELKYGSQNNDPYETTQRVELYGKGHTIRRAPSFPTVPLARVDYVTDPKRFSHDADAWWRRMGLRGRPSARPRLCCAFFGAPKRARFGNSFARPRSGARPPLFQTLFCFPDVEDGRGQRARRGLRVCAVLCVDASQPKQGWTRSG